VKTWDGPEEEKEGAAQSDSPEDKKRHWYEKSHASNRGKEENLKHKKAPSHKTVTASPTTERVLKKKGTNNLGKFKP